MSFITTLKRLLKIDYYDDYIWLSAHYIEKLNSDTYIDGTKILGGSSHDYNIILNENANLEISGNFTGKIIGCGNNIVRIKGRFTGLLSCNKLIILKGGKVQGNLWINRIVVASNSDCQIDANFNDVDSFSNKIKSFDIDFQKIKNLS